MRKSVMVDNGFYFNLTSKGVYSIPDSRTIRLLDFATGRVSVLAEMSDSNQPGGLAVSPDDAYVLWTQLDGQSRDLMLVEQFPLKGALLDSRPSPPQVTALGDWARRRFIRGRWSWLE
jgi:hypothetical protein